MFESLFNTVYTNLVRTLDSVRDIPALTTFHTRQKVMTGLVYLPH
jgi:hypothetical protein